jgi:hypothetical protein
MNYRQNPAAGLASRSNMKPQTIFALAIRLTGLFLLYKAIVSLSAFLMMSGVSTPGFQISVQHGFSRPAVINIIVLAAAAVWFLYGAHPIQDWAYPDARNENSFKSSETPKSTGPFCTACGKSIPAGATNCPACGWTQPGK